MTRVIDQQPDSLRDLREIALYIGQSRPLSARRLLRAALSTIQILAARPGIGTRYDTDDPRLADIRVSPVTRFRSYLIFYRATDDRIDVIRVLHAARDIDAILSRALDP